MGFGVLAGLLALMGLALYLARPQAPAPPAAINTVAELDEYLARVVASEHPPGLSVAVTKDDRLVYARGYGMADGPLGVSATQDSVYHWWSMTKIPTAIAVMQLHERGLLDIDDPVSNYLAFFRVTYKGIERTDVTIRQVLNHTSGLPDAIPELITWLHLEGEPPLDQTALVMAKFAQLSALNTEPGAEARYTNFGYMVLGALIEQVSGQSYETYVTDNILLPLGMQNTGFIFSDTMAANEAVGSQHVIDMYTPFLPLYRLGYIVRERSGMRFWFNRVYNDQTPPTGLIGSPTDVARLMIAYLDDGGLILEPETVAHMNAILPDLTQTNASTQGLGWRAAITQDGRRHLGHAGGGPGYATIMRIYPEENLGIVVMANDSTIDRETLADALADIDW